MNWRRFLRRETADAEQRAELEFYVDLTAQEYAARAIAYAAGENAKCDYFASHDLKDLNQHKVAIETLLPQLRIVKPTEFIAEWNERRLLGS